MNLLNAKILCFRHCDKRTDIFCFAFPNTCPVCGVCLTSADLHIPPFTLPSPFKNPHDHPYCFALKPTVGDFSQYEAGDDLHIGCTGEGGGTWDYNESGVRQNHPFWNSLAIIIPFALARYPDWEQDWDNLLSDSCHKPDWHANKYHPIDHNCHDYVLHVVQYFAPSFDKITWAERALVSHTRAAARYLTVYNHLIANAGIWVQTHGE